MDTSNTIKKSTGKEHRTKVNGQELFMWEKPRTAEPALGTILFVVWLAYQFVPGVHEFIREFQVNWPDHRFDV